MAENFDGGPPEALGGTGRPAASAHVKFVPASFGRRLAAYFIDSTVVSLVCVPVSLPAGVAPALLKRVPSLSEKERALIFIALIAISYLSYFVVAFFYSGYFLSRKGATPGKSVLDLRVVDNNTGANLNFMTAGLRATFGYVISACTLLIGFLMVLIRQDGRALHDLMMRSHVWRKTK